MSKAKMSLDRRRQAVELLENLGILDDGGSEYQLLLERHPTVQAYLADDITLKQAIWVESYLSNGYDATEATYAAGYQCKSRLAARGLGQQLARNQKIRELVSARIANVSLTANEILARYADIAEASMADFLDFDEDGKPKIDLKKARDAGRLGLLKKLRVKANGEIEISMADSEHALDQMARHHGLFERDNTLRLTPDLEAIAKMTATEREDELQELLSLRREAKKELEAGDVEAD